MSCRSSACARPPAVANDPTLPAIAAAKAKPAGRHRGDRSRTAKLAPAGALPPARIPPEALASPRNDKLLGWTFGISVAIHAIVLSIHFAPNVIKDFGRGPPLEVALVNAKTKEKPVKADVLAQANLDGGGNTDAGPAREVAAAGAAEGQRAKRDHRRDAEARRARAPDEGNADRRCGRRSRSRSRRRRPTRPSGPSCRRATR